METKMLSNNKEEIHNIPLHYSSYLFDLWQAGAWQGDICSDEVRDPL